MKVRKYVLDTNCFVDAAHDPDHRVAFARFCEMAAPMLHLSSVVAAELQAGMSSARDRKRLHDSVIAPYERRGRLITPSATSWSALGRVLSTLAERDGLVLSQTPRSFIFDILIAQSCREVGAVLISRNIGDLERIATVAPFDFVAPYPDLG